MNLIDEKGVVRHKFWQMRREFTRSQRRMSA